MFGSIIKGIAGIAGAILPLLTGGALGARKDGGSSRYNVGDIGFYPHSGKLYAQNLGDAELGMAFAQTGEEDGRLITRTEYYPVDAGGHVDVTAELIRDYPVGRLTVADTDAEINSRVGPLKILAISVSAVAVGVAIRVAGELKVGVYKVAGPDATGWEIRVGNPTPLTGFQFDATLTDAHGATAAVSATAQKDVVAAAPDEGYTETIPIPDGFDADPIIETLDFRAKMPLSAFFALTAEGRAKVRSGPPPWEQAPASDSL